MARRVIADNYQQARRTAADTLADDCSDISGWADVSGRTTTLEASSNHVTEGTQSLKIIAPVGSEVGVRAVQRLDYNIDMSEANTISFKIGYDVTKDNQQNNSTLQFYIGSGGGFGHYWVSKQLTGIAKYADQIITLKLDLTDGDFTLGAGTIDFSAITTIRVAFTNVADSDTERHVYLDAIYAGYRCKPKLLLTFDDGFDTVHDTLYSLMAARGLVGTCYVNGSTIGDAGKMTIAELTTLQTAGWLIANHSYTHTDWTTLTRAQMQSEWELNDAWLRDNGFEDGRKYYCNPNGGWNDTTDEVLAENGVICARTVISTVLMNPAGSYHTGHGLLTPYRLPTAQLGVGKLETAAQVLAAIDLSISRGLTQFIYGHDFIPSPVTANEFDSDELPALISGIADRRDAGLLDTVTVKDFVEGLSSPQRS